MGAAATDLDITAAPTLRVQTLRVVSRVNARMDGPATVSVAQVCYLIRTIIVRYYSQQLRFDLHVWNINL